MSYTPAEVKDLLKKVPHDSSSKETTATDNSTKTTSNFLDSAITAAEKLNKDLTRTTFDKK